MATEFKTTGPRVDENEVINSAIYRAASLGVQHGLDAYKIRKGRIHYLVATRRTRSGVNTTYWTDEAILNDYYKSLANEAQAKN